MKSFTNENTRLGFIGIGNMGSRLAKRLLEHGYQLLAYNRSREAAEALVKYGATVADSIGELAAEADVILSSLTNDEAVKSVYTDPEGVFAHVRRGSATIEMSTVLPATSRELWELSRKAGVKFLDSPVSGSTPAAEEGTLTLFCGGDEGLFQAAQPIFSSVANQYFYLGGSGSGTAMSCEYLAGSWHASDRRVDCPRPEGRPRSPSIARGSVTHGGYSACTSWQADTSGCRRL